MNSTYSIFKSYKSVLFFKCVVTLTLFNLLQLTNCAPTPSVVISSDDEIPTEPPELVETFNPMEWISRARLGQQVNCSNVIPLKNTQCLLRILY